MKVCIIFKCIANNVFIFIFDRVTLRIPGLCFFFFIFFLFLRLVALMPTNNLIDKKRIYNESSDSNF